jgi:hypothetical protein
MWNKKIGEIRDINIKKNVRKFYKEVKEMSKEYQQPNIMYKDETGKILMEEKDILLRWQQYFHLLLENELQIPEETQERNKIGNMEGNPEETEDDKPTYEKMISVISNMKKGKAPG